MIIHSIYSILLLIGFLGLLAQVLLGGGHGGHIGHHAQAGHAYGGQAGHSHASHSHAGQQGQGQHHTPGHHEGQSRGPSPLWALLSPLTFFSICLGAGATGLLLKHLHPQPGLVALAALLGGLLFYGLLIRPLWGLLFRFASTPSTALAGTVAKEAEALSSFDAGGKGLVRVTIDGQIVRVLATLEADDRPESPIIRPGDRLTVTSVDGRTNSCRVTRL